MFGEMSAEVRDEMLQNFRFGEENVLIIANWMARGIDVPSCEFVVNYDVPKIKENGQVKGDPETYLHRVGRTGCFGAKGIALTLIEGEEDKECFD